MAIRTALAEMEIRLHHIGSTAIPGIRAKPVIDMLGEVASPAERDRIAPVLISLGHEDMGPYGIEGRRFFRKCDDAGRRSHHLHIYAGGDPHVARHLAFRDFLRHHGARAAEYDRLKARLTRDGVKSREAYQNGKAPFIERVQAEALAWWRQSEAPTRAGHEKGAARRAAPCVIVRPSLAQRRRSRREDIGWKATPTWASQ